MQTYIYHYTLPVLVVMAVLLVFARQYQHGLHFKATLFVAAGFILGWISAYLSLYYFHLYK
jgi:hypothetical protein